MTAEPFTLRGVVHLLRPLGRQVRTLQELRDAIADIEDASVFLHVALDRMGLASDDDHELDDWSAWVRGVVQHPEAAERLEFAVSRHPQLGPALRADAIAALDRVPETERRTAAAPPGGALELLTLESVTWQAAGPTEQASELLEALRTADRSVWFWHLVEEPWRRGARSSLIEWLESHDARDTAERLDEWTRSGAAVESIRRRFARWWSRHGLRARVASAAGATPGERGAAAREAARTLVRRLRSASNAEPGA